MSDQAPSPPLSPVVVVNDATGRRTTYDAVALQIDPEPRTTDVDVDVLLLHGMTPNGRKCWNYKDHGDANVPQHDAKSISKNVRRLVEAVRSGCCSSNDGIGELRLVMPDRPGYGDSDPACEGIDEDEGAVTAGYPYRQFAGDMVRVLEHANARSDGSSVSSPRRRLRRRLILLGTSSGGPCALALRDRLLNDADSANVERLREYYDGGVAGTILCSSDGPYAHRDCPPEIVAEDGKALGGRTKWEHVREESRKPFRKNSRLGWIVDYTLERVDWGFDLLRDGSEEGGFCSPAVRIYVGGPRDFATSRLCGSFLRDVIGDDAVLERMEDHDHFYASRKPAVLARMVLGLIDFALTDR